MARMTSTEMLFPNLPEQRDPRARVEDPDDIVWCHRCHRQTRRSKAFPEEKMLRLVYVCRRCTVWWP